MDQLRPINPKLGLHFIEDPDLPWLQEKTVKVGIGDHPIFGNVNNWLRIGTHRASKANFDFTMDINRLDLGRATKVNFIFCYRVVSVPTMRYPVAFLRMLKDALLPGEVCCLVDMDSETAIRQGKGFDGLISHAAVGRLVDEAGFARKIEVDFRIGLPCWDSADRGWFASS